jgi:hypothetical protein
LTSWPNNCCHPPVYIISLDHFFSIWGGWLSTLLEPYTLEGVPFTSVFLDGAVVEWPSNFGVPYFIGWYLWSRMQLFPFLPAGSKGLSRRSVVKEKCQFNNDGVCMTCLGSVMSSGSSHAASGYNTSTLWWIVGLVQSWTQWFWQIWAHGGVGEWVMVAWSFRIPCTLSLLDPNSMP